MNDGIHRFDNSLGKEGMGDMGKSCNSTHLLKQPSKFLSNIPETFSEEMFLREFPQKNTLERQLFSSIVRLNRPFKPFILNRRRRISVVLFPREKETIVAGGIILRKKLMAAVEKCEDFSLRSAE
ncbi:MAG: hypothetical protein JSS95_08530 [Acidobacteria bacterium]|nr:hypothetical protein [Acidobacteriota bacterium]